MVEKYLWWKECSQNNSSTVSLQWLLCLALIQFWPEHKNLTSLNFQWVTLRIIKWSALRQFRLAQPLFQCFSAEWCEESFPYPALCSCWQLGGSSLPDENQLQVEVITEKKLSCESWSRLLNAEQTHMSSSKLCLMEIADQSLYHGKVLDFVSKRCFNKLYFHLIYLF